MKLFTANCRRQLPLIFSILLTCCFTTSHAQYVTIPDTNFVNFLQQKFPVCMNGNQMDTTCPAIILASMLSFDAQNRVSDFTGIQYFDSLDSLYVSGSWVTILPALPVTLDFLRLNGCTQLTSLPPLPPGLKGLDYSNNWPVGTLPPLPSSLEFLNCPSNSLSTLPALPGNLKELRCDFNQLTSLPALPAGLVLLFCDVNALTSLPALPNTLLQLYCSGNQLTSLPTLPPNLAVLFCWGNQLTSLPALPNALWDLNCSYNQLSALPPLSNAVLTRLNFTSNMITTLPTLPDTTMYDLYCSDNPIVALPALPSVLSGLYCDSMPFLTSLPELPPTISFLQIMGNPNLHCLPKLPDMGFFLFDTAYVNCLPNYPNVVVMSSPPLNTVPLCDAFNPHGCPEYWNFSAPCVDTVNGYTCVWPGDANDDGIANVQDVLNIGVAYGDSFAVRPNASTNWTGQPMQDWPQSFSTLGTNYKHADCNGDAIIDSFDLQPILDNYGLVHLKGSPSQKIGVPLYLIVQPGPYTAGSTVSVDVFLGTQTEQVADFYGIAFSVSYNPAVVQPGSVTVDYSNSWVGTTGVDLIGIHQEFSSLGRIDIGVTRIDKANRSGYGRLIRINYILIDDIAGKDSIELPTLSPSIGEAIAIRNDETEIELNLSVSVAEEKMQEQVFIYPNPAENILYIQIPASMQATSVRIYDRVGKEVYRTNYKEQKLSVDTHKFPEGIYLVEIAGKQNKSVHKMTIVH